MKRKFRYDRLIRLILLIFIAFLILTILLTIIIRLFNPIKKTQTIVLSEAVEVTPNDYPRESETSLETAPNEQNRLCGLSVVECKDEIVEEICGLDEISCLIKAKAEEYEIDWKIAVSIALHETGRYTSDNYLYKNNVGGTCYLGIVMTFNTLEEGIEFFISNLKRNYFDKGLTTLELIQPIYCPIGAKNDPKGLNKNWLSGTTRIYESLEA